MNKKKGYANMAMREGEMTACILNEGTLNYDKETDSITVKSELRIDDIVELDMKIDNTYDPYNIPFVRKCVQSSPSCMGLIVSQPLWQSLPIESKTIQDWAELRSNRYYRFAVVYLLRPIAVINNRYVLTSEILKEIEKAKGEQSWRKFILERAAIDSNNELHTKGINADALRGLCLEYDVERGAFHGGYEGFEILEFFLETVLKVQPTYNEEEWNKRVMELHAIKEKAKEKKE